MDDLSRYTDDELIAELAVEAEVRRRSDARTAALSGEIARRSRPDMGAEGLAQRLGYRTPERLVEVTARVSTRDANVMVRVGALDGAVADALQAGAISLESAAAISAIETPELEEQLVAEAAILPPKEIAVRARRLRDERDAEGVGERERAQREQNSFRYATGADGMTDVWGRFSPESWAVIRPALDAAASPRRRVRFADADGRPAATSAPIDTRTTPQLMADAIVEFVRIASTVGSDEVLGAQRPAVALHVTAADLDRRTGSGAFDGVAAAVSIETVERHICANGYVPILFDDDGQVLNLGRDQRLFTSRQRIALGARDGGCRFPGCDRPPSWCEAHHIDQWWRDGGRTDVADGILLCRHHHLLIHNNGWRVTRDGAEYSVVPPRSIDPAQTSIPAPARPAVSTGRPRDLTLAV